MKTFFYCLCEWYRSCKKTKVLTICCIVSMTICAIPVNAQDSKGQNEQLRTVKFNLIDINGDGIISSDESALRHEQVFAEIDFDDDDTLSLEEYMAVRFGGGNQGTGYGERRLKMNKRKQARFRLMDRDGDGVVRKLEFLASGKAQHEMADTDNDKKVTIWEYRAARRF
ncbi:EF-hand domain-containing protein [Pseudomonadota bacterium]